MKTITKYQAHNGEEFDKADTCAIYEANCRRADAIIAQLPPLPKDVGRRFSNGYGYLQHTPQVFFKARRELLEQAQKEFPHRHLIESIADESVHPSWAGRIIAEACTLNLGKAWYRITCTDGQLREWGQPYYALHPNEAPEQRPLN